MKNIVKREKGSFKETEYRKKSGIHVKSLFLTRGPRIQTRARLEDCSQTQARRFWALFWQILILFAGVVAKLDTTPAKRIPKSTEAEFENTLLDTKKPLFEMSLESYASTESRTTARRRPY